MNILFFLTPKSQVKFIDDTMSVRQALEVMDFYRYSTIPLLTKDGEIYRGANIENASFSLTMCAERNAIFNAYCHGVTQDDIEALAIVADTELPVSPCGSCRQVLSELFPHDKKIYLANLRGDIKETTVDELLPYSFDSDDL